MPLSRTARHSQRLTPPLFRARSEEWSCPHAGEVLDPLLPPSYPLRVDGEDVQRPLVQNM